MTLPSTPRPVTRTRQMTLAALAAAGTVALALVGASAVSGSAGAQALTTSGGPIQIEADDLVLRPQDRTVLLTGNAVVIQDGAALRSATLRITYLGRPEDTGGEVDKVFADSEVFYVTPTERIRGDRGVYDARNNQITFSGRVTVVQGQSVLEGSELTINTVTRASRMRGADGRVRAVFFPDRTAQPRPAQQARPAPATP